MKFTMYTKDEFVQEECLVGLKIDWENAVEKIDKTNFISYAVGSLSVPLLNTLLFMSTLFILFYNSAPIQNIASDKGADNVFALFTAMVGVQALIEAGICFAIGTAVSKALAVALKKVKK